MAPTERIWDEETQRKRLVKTSTLLFLFIIIYCLGIALLIIGVYYFELGEKWAILPLEQWLFSAIILIIIAICLEMILTIHFILSKKKHLASEKPITMLDGKQVHSYTIPSDAKNGIFSKTYILIDGENILNLRYQMVPPADLWEQTQ